MRPDFEKVANNLAWLLATSPDPSIRRPADAVRFAERAAEFSDGTAPGVLDTLAAAYASAGRFDEALRAQERALALAREVGEPTLAADFEGRLRLYRAGRDYVDEAKR